MKEDPAEIERQELERFEELVEEALESLPPHFAQRMENIDVVVRAEPSRKVLRDMGFGPDETLLGIYHGIPQTERTTAYGSVLPDRIEIYREPTPRRCRAPCTGWRAGPNQGS